MEAINKEIISLLEKGAIKEISGNEVAYLSTIFTVPKKTGDLRPIINLKKLNEFVKYDHFKMETFKDVKEILMPNDYLTSIDLKDAYFSIPIYEGHHRYLCFTWNGKFYCFCCLPFGLSSAPRVFTKTMKPVIAFLRSRGMRVMIYLDDILIFAPSVEESTRNTECVINLLSSLGFTINFEKSNIQPKTSLNYLGFHLDSANMIASLPVDKIDRLKSFGRSILSSLSVKIRDLAKFIGFLTSSFDVFPQGRLHFRVLEIFKTKALQSSGGNFDACVSIDSRVAQEIQWWISIPNEAFRSRIETPAVHVTIRTDASNSGWGALCENDNSFSQATWSQEETNLHINALELLAIQRGLASLCESSHNVHIHVKSDNSTAVAYVKKLGGNVQHLNQITSDIWRWAFDRKIWLTASHLAGIDNSEADILSRRDMNKELNLRSDIFSQLLSNLSFIPDVDLFASKANKKLPIYVSWKFDPVAKATDAFSISWNSFNIYMFPPFCLLSRVLHKFRRDQCKKALLIAPLWRAQPWFPLILQHLIAPPLILPRDCLVPLPIPMLDLKLVAWIISTDVGAQQEFQRTLPASSPNRGGTVPINNTSLRGNSGYVGAINNRLIHWVQL